MKFSHIVGFVIVLVMCLWTQPVQSKPLEGYYTEEQVRFQTEDQPDDIVIRKSWYCGQMMAKDEQWQGITIARMDRNQIHILDPQMKVYFTVTPEVLRQNVGSQLQLFGAQKDEKGNYYFPEDLFVRTGTTKEVGRWECYQVMTNPKYRNPETPYIIFWYSTQVDFPVKVFGDQLKNFFGDTPEVRGLFDRITKFEGYPVRTEAHGLDNTVITTLLKLDYRRNIDPQIFEIPKEYNQIALPGNLPAPQWGK
jgi:hypothetical protein